MLVRPRDPGSGDTAWRSCSEAGASSDAEIDPAQRLTRLYELMRRSGSLHWSAKIRTA